MSSYARVFFQLGNNGQTREIIYPVVASRAALLAFVEWLKTKTCAVVKQVELCEIINIQDNLAVSGQYADLDFVAMIGVRDEEFSLSYLPIPAPVDGVLEKKVQEYLITDTAGESAADAYYTLTGVPSQFDGGTLIT